MKHTPTPWRAHDSNPAIIWSPEGQCIVDMTREHEHFPETAWANREFIVTAVNSHAELVALARRIDAQDEFTHSADADLSTRQICALVNAWRKSARAALAKVKP